MVILPAADYERLLALAEDARDLAIVREALAGVEKGSVETLTDTEMKELLGAVSPVAFWRRRRGLTQASLAKQAGITQAYLAQIESGRRAGHIRVYRRLSASLGVDVELLQPGD
jgi:DNA-binding XRE family transcriptional regulator